MAISFLKTNRTAGSMMAVRRIGYQETFFPDSTPITLSIVDPACHVVENDIAIRSTFPAWNRRTS